MKVSVTTLALSLAGYVAAQGMNGGQGPAAMAHKWAHAAQVMHDLNMFNLKAVMGQVSGGTFRETIHGKLADVNNFIDQLNEMTVQQIEGDDFGKPFKFDFYSPDERYLGWISGYFSSDGVQFDTDSKLPDGATLPSGGGGGGSGAGSKIKPFTGKADADITRDVIKNGKISDDQLKKIMGKGFGQKPFDITLIDGSGKKVGQIVGGFNKDGTVIDVKKTKIPKFSGSSSAPPTTSSSPAPGDDVPNANHGDVTLTGTSDELKGQLNNLSYDYIYKATGGNYGPFYITFTSSDGKIKGYIKGTISPNSYSYQWAYTYTG